MVTSWTEKRSRVAFSDVIKIATMVIKTTFENSKIIYKIRDYVLKFIVYLYFLIFCISGEKMLMSAELKRCVS